MEQQKSEMDDISIEVALHTQIYLLMKLNVITFGPCCYICLMYKNVAGYLI